MAAAVEPFELALFQPQFAAQIAEWAGDERQLRWLAPSTDPPLTAEKVVEWASSGCRRYVLQREPCTHFAADEQRIAEILGYAELNRMKTVYRGWWIGHLVVNPAFRGQGIGRRLLDLLLRQGFQRLRALSICLIVFPDNLAAIRCYEGAGFVCTGEEFHYFRGKTERERLLRYELTLQQWRHKHGT